MKQLIWTAFRKLGVGPILWRIHPKSGLRTLGWFRSFRVKASVDRNGDPLAWWTYPAIHFLEERLTHSMRVLEFGSGASTLWLAKRTREVVSIENCPAWADRLEPQLPSNVTMIRANPEDPFPGFRQSLPGPFDVLVIDADADRIQCAELGLEHLTESGVIIWDNTDGPDWPTIKSRFNAQGFREISFQGFTPQEVALSRTTVFYRTANCLGI